MCVKVYSLEVILLSPLSVYRRQDVSHVCLVSCFRALVGMGLVVSGGGVGGGGGGRDNEFTCRSASFLSCCSRFSTSSITWTSPTSVW